MNNLNHIQKDFLKSSNQVKNILNATKDKSLFWRRVFQVSLIILFALSYTNSYSAEYANPIASKNNRARSIKIDFQESFFYTEKNEWWQTDQILLYYGYSGNINDILPFARAKKDEYIKNQIYWYSNCRANHGIGFSGYEFSKEEYISFGNDSWLSFTWYNVPDSLKIQKLFILRDNDAKKDDDCIDWNNSSFLTWGSFDDYFSINPTVDYTASIDNPNRVKINYTITNSENRTEDAKYTIILYNGNNVEVARKNAVSAINGEFYVAVSNPEEFETFTLKVNTSLNIDGRTIPHAFEKSVTVSKTFAPIITTPLNSPCSGSVTLFITSLFNTSIVERCENKNFNGATLVLEYVTNPIPVGLLFFYSYTDSQDLISGKTYYYRVRTWGKVYSDVVTVKADFTPTKPDKLVLSVLKTGIGLAFPYYKCANVTKYKIKRKEKGKAGEIELAEVPATDFLYTDYDASSCIEYAYRIVAINDKGVESASDWSDYKYYTLDITKALSNFRVDKGYFPNKTGLSWTSEGLLDEFVILRKIYGSTGNPKQILSVDAKSSSSSSASRDYQVDDLSGNPGVVYEYTIRGLLSCAGNNAQSNDLKSIGFRTPTGTVYGRVTYKGGQIVENIDVLASSDDVDIKGSSFSFNGSSAYLRAADPLNTLADTAFTVQVWIRPDVTDKKNKTIFRKPGKYELGFDGTGNLFFADATDRVSFNYGSFNATDFVHVSGVRAANKLMLYANDSLLVSKDVAANIVVNNTDSIYIGRNNNGNYFKGYIDEVRLWNKALSKKDIKRDYTRLLAGNEKALTAYWRFNEPVAHEFYDLSYKNSTYNEHHGKVYHATRSSLIIPTTAQLTLKGVTDDKGNYMISGIPYLGEGTIYTFRPRFDIHQFDPISVDRIINAVNSSYVIDFVDISSFPLKVTIRYENSTYPVKGVGFKVDGVVVVRSDGTPASTDDKGEATLSIPIGVHKVQAFMSNHNFIGEGYITTPSGADRNYQGEGTAFLQDATKLRVIGRVAGGAVQASIPVGFSQSKNNLGDDAVVTISLAGDKYNLTNTPANIQVTQYKPKMEGENFVAKTNIVDYQTRSVKVYPNTETGEFAVDLIPVNFNVTAVSVTGYGNIISQNIPLDLSSMLNLKQNTISWNDSVVNSVSGIKELKTFSDTIKFNANVDIIHRVNPTIKVAQLQGSSTTPLFGDSEIVIPTYSGINDIVKVYDSNTKKYLFNDRPVFVQGQKYKFGISVFESYKYNNAIGGAEDKVPSKDGTVEINNSMDSKKATHSLAIDSTGQAIYVFNAGNPDLTSGVKTIDISAKIKNGTYTWTFENPFIFNSAKPGAFVLGSKSTGTNFITAGPDEVLMVIRDPHGTGSSSYVEKGTVVNVSSTISSGVNGTTNQNATTSLGGKVITWVGVGGGTTIEAEVIADVSLSVNTEETSSLSGTEESTVTLLSKFSTSDSPNWVGHDADLFIGNSTNLTYGAVNNVVFVKQRNKSIDDILLWSKNNSNDEDYVLVSQKSFAGQKSFGTLFVYVSAYIEKVLLPNLSDIRDKILESNKGLTEAEAQNKANDLKQQVYLSKIMKGDPGFGIPNIDDYWGDDAAKSNEYYKGKSYTIYFPEGTKSHTDTILILNQSITAWKNRLADNEKAKIEAILDKNYSFSVGSNISISKQTQYTKITTSEYTTVIGGGVGSVIGGDLLGIGTTLSLNTSLAVTTGSTHSQSHSESYNAGFTLVEDAGYLSEDVSIAKDGSYVFKLKGGATACPHQGLYTSTYYKPGTVIDQPSMQMEVPKIAIKGKTQLTGIPSNKKGVFQLQLTNESESGDDATYVASFGRTFTLRIDESSNPDGASFYLDGAPLGDGRSMLIRYGKPLLKTLEIGKGPNAMDYSNLRLTLSSDCDKNVADTISVNVSYIPSCSDISLEFPQDKWVINTNSGETEKTQILNLSVKAYDVNYSNLNSIVLEYKPSSASESDWTPIQSYFIDSTAYKASPLQAADKQILEGGGISYDFHTYKLDNRFYDIRAKSVCKIGVDDIISYTNVASGIKDAVRPRLFGSPLPANGILTIKDEVRLNFSEDIAEGLLVKDNFQVKGILNGSQGDHSSSLFFDGMSDYVSTEAEKNMAGKSITLETWVKRDQLGKATLFSHGNINNSFEFGFNANNKLEVKIGSQTITTTNIFNDVINWQHLAVVYDAGKNQLAIYHNFKAVVQYQAVDVPYSGNGNMEFARSISAQNGYLAGQMHELRIWNKVISEANLQANSLKILSGGELGLIGYWPMNESKGDLAFDKAGGANGAIHGALWYINPRGKAIKLSGVNSSVAIKTGAVIIKPDMEFTIELWFKGAAQTNATLISNGRGDGLDYDFDGTGNGSRDLLWIGFNENGALTVKNNGYESSVEGDFLDDNWHQLAFAVNRRGNAQVMVDGDLKNYFEASNIGGLVGSYLYLGARNYKDFVTGDPKKDQFFKGYVDEFRIWNLYLNQTLIMKNNNIRLKGDEMGLMAYYPFDEYITFQGETFLQFTSKDVFAKSVADAAVLAGAFESDDVAPVKGRGPIKTLDFDFVVNKDALIINLLQNKADIEKTIITFTVDNVQDMNGNTIASPITWTAYVNRNQIKWEYPKLDLVKAESEAIAFTVKIINTGGTAERFSIENLPAWLSASVSSGTIDPDAFVAVTFSVNPAINIGTYDQVIYLRNSDNVVEALNLNLKVKGETPDWKVNPSAYLYNMSVYSKLRINNIFSKDPEDLIAAFEGGKCVGVAHVQYESRNDMWYTFITVYSNKTTHNNLSFKIWDSSTGKIYLADAGKMINFANNSVIGTPTNPIIFDGKEIIFQNLALEPGWNWISFNVQSDDLNTLEGTLANLDWTSSNFFKSEADNVSANYSAIESRWVSEKAIKLNNTSMYKISSSINQTLSLAGVYILPSSKAITLEANKWNYISYLPSVRLTLDEALAGYNASNEDVIKSQKGFAMYAQNIGWVGSLSYLEPNRGYMMKRKDASAASFKYPNNSGSMSAKSSFFFDEISDYVNVNYSGNMNLVAVSNIEPQPNDRILAYIGDDLSSESEIQRVNGDLMYFITVSGKDNRAVSFALERNGEILGVTNQVLTYSDNAISGNVYNPTVLKFSKEKTSLQVYPNPVKDKVSISILSASASTITIRILDVMGREMIMESGISLMSGLSKTEIDCSQLNPGVYFLYTTIDGVVSVSKIEKQ